jgi:hypothetical protein
MGCISANDAVLRAGALTAVREVGGVSHIGQLFAQSVVAEPRLGAALMGILTKGLGIASPP